MQTITIDGVDYAAYQSVENADLYLRVSRFNAAWKALSEDDRGARLVRVSRRLDQLFWISGFQTQAERFADQRVKNATSLFAAITIEDPESVEPGEESVPLDTVQAGDTSITFHESDAKTPQAGASDDAVYASRLGIPAAVYTIIKELITLARTPLTTESSIGSPMGKSGRRRFVSESRGWDFSD